MSSTSDACSKKVGPESCKKNDDGTCTFTKMCTIKTPEGEFPCECVCTCKCTSGKCDKCECKCDCTLERAQKIVLSDGSVKYRCECTCSC
ncbi:hypothetical protein FQR65_LT08772 [Abscondita terminalis]|nr:hypothetical protein FQR65_LT08772 [Abscondita terminalis]